MSNKIFGPFLIGLVVLLVVLSGSMFTVDQRQNAWCSSWVKSCR